MIINSSAGYYLFIPADVNDPKRRMSKEHNCFHCKKSNFPGLSHILLPRSLLKVSDNATKSVAVWTTDAW